MNLEIYKGKKVFITGHTGFKGSWLTYWLQMLGTDVVGYSLSPITNPNHFELLRLNINSYTNNICDFETLQKAIQDCQPDIIFHLAAQPLVRYSYHNPIETYQTNVMGTINVMEASRHCESVKAIIIITTDKCYENYEQNLAYVETDRMGGYDPYSASKGCAELAVSSYRRSYFNLEEYNKSHQTLIATARAGNVIGGGDWSDDRLIPDLIKGAIEGKKALIRYPQAKRPWQHVLEPLLGYLMLGEKLLNGKKDFAEAWNFGPEENSILTVLEVLELTNKFWNKITYEIDKYQQHFHEAGLLSLNINKAKTKIGWKPRWNNQQSIEQTVNWYRAFYEEKMIMTEMQINNFIS